MTTEGEDFGPLEALVLAAGAGLRFGGGKLLAPWREGVLLDAALAAAFAAPVRAVSVVWGADEDVARAATAFAQARGEVGRLRLVHATDHALGLSRSLKAGIEALADDVAGLFILLGDMPRIPASVFPALASALQGDALAVAPTFEGRRGHPVLVHATLLPKLADRSGDRGAGGILAELGYRLIEIPVADDGVLYDVDRPQDLEPHA